MPVKRALGLTETYVKYCYDYANGTTGVIAMIQLSGPLSSELMNRAVFLAQTRHPVLRASFSGSDEKADYLEIDAEPADSPLETIQRMNSEQWQYVYAQHFNEPFVKKSGYLWRATLLLDDSGKEPVHELVVSFHHAIIDGISIGIFFRDLLNYCGIISAGGNPDVQELPLLPPVEALLSNKISWSDHVEKNKSGFLQLLELKKDLYEYEKDVPLHQRKSRTICRETDKTGLARIINLSRENNTTLTSLLSAALLMAVYKTKDREGKGVTRKQIATTPVNMRENCNPNVGKEYIGCFISAVTTVHSTDLGTSLWNLARSFGKDLEKAIKEQSCSPEKFDREAFIGMMGNLKTGEMAQRFPLGIGVTNYGILDLPTPVDGPFHLKKFYSGATRHWGDWLMLLHTATMGERLFYGFCYEEPLLSDETAEEIVREFFSILDFK